MGGEDSFGPPARYSIELDLIITCGEDPPQTLYSPAGTYTIEPLLPESISAWFSILVTSYVPELSALLSVISGSR